MLEIVAFWAFLTVLTALLFAPWYNLAGYWAGLYAKSVHNRINKDWRKADEFEDAVRGFIMKPWNMLLDFFNIRRNNYYNTEGHIVPTVIGGVGAFISLLTIGEMHIEATGELYAVTYGIPATYIFMLTAASKFLAAWLKYPAILGLGILLFDRVIVKAGIRALSLKSKLDKLTGSDS